MNELLATVVAAHGGLDRWNRIRAIRVGAAITGAFWQIKGKGDALTNIRFEVDTTREPFETADVDQLLAVLTEEARWEMPPIATWFEGRETIVAFLTRQMRMIGPAELVATSANGRPAFAVYARGHDGAQHPHTLQVLTITAEGVCRIVTFHGSGLFPLFGL
ncbi:nuclear transport factor 2 family protein [Nocardia sp. NPDC052278]|uniref:nuclear transport factor 2 family protein n=1 Tax=unclassified Nocardia TaxID=2637762 RepID=UPI0036842844